MHAVALLRANDAVRRYDTEAWLGEVNSFFDHFGVAGIALQPARPGVSLFERLTTEKLPEIHQGPVVTVIMPAWNASKTIEYAVRSILNQTWKPIQLIVVDDASTDDTWQIISRLAQEDSRLQPLRNAQNVGPYVSKNIALNYATGLWVTGHDADDWAHPQRVEKHVGYLTANNQAASLMGMLRMSGRGAFTRLSPLGPNTQDGACVAGFISMMCERTFFNEKIGHWDEMRFGGDSEVIRRIENVTKKTMKRFNSVGMICLDNPDGLTNHPQFGHKPGVKIAPERQEYKASFVKWHSTLGQADSYLEFPQSKRRFSAPTTALNPPGVVAETYKSQTDKAPPVSEKIETVDLCLVTNLRFPGGNASSSLDELRHFRNKGLTVKVVHCPIDSNLGKPISERFYEHGDLVSLFSDFAHLKCKTLIVRHPAVVASSLFQKNMNKLDAESAYFVINNSHKRTSGELVYSMEELLETAKQTRAKRFRICPISPLMRSELREALPETVLSEQDWTPTFDLESYQHAPRSTLIAPFTIGRHGRDGAEKWLEDPALLSQAFPDHIDFRIKVWAAPPMPRVFWAVCPTTGPFMTSAASRPRTTSKIWTSSSIIPTHH
ncbi:glycosyltransferase [Rhodobacteraceae bacterium D3-12]|nr:glycosyltransferase [Rhodobacteraceae bacterium D3-12]